ncbi:MAG: hypothetical protein EAZ27_12295 [Cytophagales bacterium]|nr:MAG: hypothetical protein EAZ27_12295 [Cytophagales bacterium]
MYGLKEIEDLAIDGKINVGMETIVLENDGEHAFRIEDNSKKTGIGLPGKSIIGIINVNELIRLQNKYHRNQLYSENIRLYLGDRQTVNRDIIKTISSDESLWFPYMNNGISIICEKLVIGIPTQKGLNIEMNNMQIINGCQTVNALYNAKYGEETKDNFKSSKVLIKIYEIDSTQERFKLSVIKATNNQNAVKPSSLVANDLIQISIQAKMKVLGYLYDRKGESKLIIKSTKPINMINAALAYRAVFWFAAQQLRSGIGQGKVFKDDEYKKLFKQEYLEVDQELKFNEFVIKLLISTLILDNIRELITLNSIKFKDFAIFKKSLYYLSGFYYAKYFSQINELILEVTNLLAEENYPKIKNFQKLDDFQKQISSNFFSLVNDFKEFYSNLTIDKSDIDNLLKSSQFGKAYLEIPEIKNITLLNLS